jgi:hypothetical protein
MLNMSPSIHEQDATRIWQEKIAAYSDEKKADYIQEVNDICARDPLFNRPEKPCAVYLREEYVWNQLLETAPQLKYDFEAHRLILKVATTLIGNYGLNPCAPIMAKVQSLSLYVEFIQSVGKCCTRHLWFGEYVRNLNKPVNLGPPSTSPTAIAKIAENQILTQIEHNTAKTNALALIKQDGRTDLESVMRAQVQGMRMVLDKELILQEEEHFSDTAPDYSPLMKRKLDTSAPSVANDSVDASGGDRCITRLHSKRATYAYPSPNDASDDEGATVKSPLRKRTSARRSLRRF